MNILTNQKLKSLSLYGGHIMECFDNTLYGFFAVMLSGIFFPNESREAALLASYAAFAAGFVARPLGGIAFGLIGDRIGRRQSLLWTLVFVGIPTIIIALTPSYQSIGIWAPITIVICRLLQGFFYGGEFTGVNVYIYETVDNGVRGKNTGLMIGAGTFGAFIATAVGAICTMKSLPNWAWRIPFLLGGIGSLMIYFLRRSLGETQVFEQVKTKNKVLSFPLKIVLSHYKFPMLVTACLAGLSVMPLYSSTVLGNRIFQEIGYSTSESMMLNMIVMFYDAAIVAFYGRLSDRVGFARMIMLGCAAVMLSVVPAFWCVTGNNVTTIDVYIFILVLNTTGSIMVGCFMPFIASLFPAYCRYSAVAFSTTLGSALLGGTLPMIGSYLTDTFATRMAPSFWIASVAFVSLIGVYLLQKRTVRYDELASTSTDTF